MTKRKITKAGDVLPAVLKSLGLEERFREQKLLGLWPQVVGEELAARTKASRVERGTLFVRVDHGAWIQELHFIEKDLIRKLRRAVPGVELNSIRFSAKEVV